MLKSWLIYYCDQRGRTTYCFSLVDMSVCVCLKLKCAECWHFIQTIKQKHSCSDNARAYSSQKIAARTTLHVISSRITRAWFGLFLYHSKLLSQPLINIQTNICPNNFQLKVLALDWPLGCCYTQSFLCCVVLSDIVYQCTLFS